MLKEDKNIRQVPGESPRRWFSDDYFDLIVWEDAVKGVFAFQLCYDRYGDEHALVWHETRGYEHYRVDEGGIGQFHKATPMMMEDGIVDAEALKKRFEHASANLEEDLARSLLDRMDDWQSPANLLSHDLPVQRWGDTDANLGGIYVLRFIVQYELWVRVGRFNQGVPISFAEGEYLYVGPARRGLAARLVRHATRSWGLPPHGIQESILDIYDRTPPKEKKRHWHIDYILDQDDVELQNAYALHTPSNLESTLADWALAQPETEIVMARMGASDRRVGTHLLRINEGGVFWGRMGDWLAQQAKG